MVPRPVRNYIAFYLFLFVVFWVIAIVSTYAKAHREGKTFTAYSMAFNNGYHRFRDFTDFDRVEENFTSDTGVKGNNYPPSLICVYLAFTRYFRNPIRVYLGFEISAYSVIGLGLSLVLWRLGRNSWLLAISASVTIAAGYPFLFLLERGNVEGPVFILNAVALTAFVLRRHFLAATAISLAASMKIFPGCATGIAVSPEEIPRVRLGPIAHHNVPIEIVSLWLIGPTILRRVSGDQGGHDQPRACIFCGICERGDRIRSFPVFAREDVDAPRMETSLRMWTFLTLTLRKLPLSIQ